jgi:peptide/nickel transport system permease protein
MGLLRGLLEGTRRGTRLALALVAAYVLLAAGARWVAPQPVQDLRSLDLMNSSIPPAWDAEGRREFLLGTDEQGRDVLSGVLFGLRLSMGVGFAAVALAMVIGLAAGLLSGYRGGWLDAFLMRIADAQLTFPAILVAMLLDGVARSVLPRSVHEALGVRW